jgi:hypothetical protein
MGSSRVSDTFSFLLLFPCQEKEKRQFPERKDEQQENSCRFFYSLDSKDLVVIIPVNSKVSEEDTFDTKSREGERLLPLDISM